MTSDPFDRLRERNPVSDDRLPEAPMSTAERIIAAGRRHRPMPGWAMAAVVAMSVAVIGGAWLLFIGGDAGDEVAAGTSTSSVSTAPSAEDVATTQASAGVSTTTPTTGSPPPTEGPDTTAAESTTTTITDVSTTLPPVGYSSEYPIYLFLDDNGTETVPGPFLIPTIRTTAVLSAPVTNLHGTIAAFLAAGPTPGEREAVPAMSSEIPEGTRVLDVVVADGIATIDLSRQFVSGGGSLSMMGRVAQVVFTLTAFEDVDGVLFEIEGAPTTVFGGEGIVVDTPATRAGFAEFLPPIMIEDPPHWGTAGNPLVVTGTADVFEATVSLALVDGDGEILWEGFTTASCGTGCRGEFSVEIPYAVEEPQMGAIIAWEASARDGSQTNVREHPVWLAPAGSVPAAPTADLWQQIQDLRRNVVRFSEEIDAVGDLALAADDPAEADRLRGMARMLVEEQAALRDELAAAVDEALALGWSYELILDETCSGAAADTALLDGGLDRPALETWGSLHHAATTCDWDELAVLAGDDLRVTFGPPGDPIEFWQREEALGYEPLRHLAEILNRPIGRLDPGDGSTILVWPSAFAYDSWDAVPEADRQALRPLYGDADMAGFAEFGGYAGYRVGMDEATGDWLFFVTGD